MARVDGAPTWYDGRPLVVCVDGPRHGHCYYLTGKASWEERVRLAQWDRETRAGATLGYELTDEKRAHPADKRITVQVLRWAPKNGEEDHA
jgi:hypothetical protein